MMKLSMGLVVKKQHLFKRKQWSGYKISKDFKKIIDKDNKTETQYREN